MFYNIYDNNLSIIKTKLIKYCSTKYKFIVSSKNEHFNFFYVLNYFYMFK